MKNSFWTRFLYKLFNVEYDVYDRREDAACTVVHCMTMTKFILDTLGFDEIKVDWIWGLPDVVTGHNSIVIVLYLDESDQREFLAEFVGEHLLALYKAMAARNNDLTKYDLEFVYDKAPRLHSLSVFEKA